MLRGFYREINEKTKTGKSHSINMQPVFITWFLQNLIWPPTRLALYLFAHFKIYGADNLNELKGGVIFVGNHMSELDPILLPAPFPWFSRFSPIFYVSREKTFYNIR